MKRLQVKLSSELLPLIDFTVQCAIFGLISNFYCPYIHYTYLHVYDRSTIKVI